MWGMVSVRAHQHSKGLPRVSRGQRRAGVEREGTVVSFNVPLFHARVEWRSATFFARIGSVEAEQVALPKRVERREAAFLLEMPERPAVAGGRPLRERPDSVDRSRLAIMLDRAVGPDPGQPAPLRVGQGCPRLDHPDLDEDAVRHPRLSPLRGHRLHRALVELEGRGDALARDPDIAFLALDPDPLPAQPPGDGAGRAGAE